MKSLNQRSTFQYLVNDAAFVDKAIFNVWGTRRKNILPKVKLGKNLAIGGPMRMYARSRHGENRLTENPFELRYGRLHKWRAVAPFRLVVRSERLPLSGAQVRIILDSLFRKGYRCQASQLELTFDVSQYSFLFFRRQLFSNARSIIEFQDRLGRNTFYGGTARSPWQLRVYQKTSDCVRVEFVLRRAYLRDHALRSIEELVGLRKVDLANLAQFLEFRGGRLTPLLKRTRHFWGKDLLLQSPQRWPLQLLISVLRYRGRMNPEICLRCSKAQLLLNRMLGNFVW